MSKKTIALISLSVILFGFFFVSYFSFSKYQPKVLKKVHEVKGMSSIITDDVPYPSDAVKIGTSQTPTSKQTTFKTEKSQIEVKDFYKNIYAGKEWKLISEKTIDGTIMLTFKKDVVTVKIVITAQDDMGYTVVSIERIEEDQ